MRLYFRPNHSSASRALEKQCEGNYASDKSTGTRRERGLRVECDLRGHSQNLAKTVKCLEGRQLCHSCTGRWWLRGKRGWRKLHSGGLSSKGGGGWEEAVVGTGGGRKKRGHKVISHLCHISHRPTHTHTLSISHIHSLSHTHRRKERQMDVFISICFVH